MQNDFVKASLGDELDKVERHLNQGKQFSDWLGIRVYDPKRQENDEIQWHLKKNPSNKLKNIRTIRFIKGRIKHMNNLGKALSCVDCRERFTKTCNLQRHATGYRVIENWIAMISRHN